jgi:hypothetical protein
MSTVTIPCAGAGYYPADDGTRFFAVRQSETRVAQSFLSFQSVRINTRATFRNIYLRIFNYGLGRNCIIPRAFVIFPDNSRYFLGWHAQVAQVYG